MICPVCQSTNESDANFCISCNFRISVVCPRCSRRVISHAKYCDRCGYSLDSMSEENKSSLPADQIAGEYGYQNVEGVPPDLRSPLEIQNKFPPVVNPSSKSELTQIKDPVTDVKNSIKGQKPDSVKSGSPLAQYLPKALMKRLENARESGDMVGERRVVTILFCDIKGSTHAAEQLDPEEWSEIINGAFEHMIKPIYKYEGTVARLMGDGILAFFGAPFAHEDDPQRSVRAGLEILSGIATYREIILQDWGIEINVRIGINTGLVVVGSVGSDLRMEYTALGDAINLAARMEQTAEPGTVQVAQDTYKLIKPLFEFEELGEIAVKGKDEPILAYRVIGRKVGYNRVRGIEGLYAEMVGRDREMEVLRRVTEDLRQGVGRIVFILGEAGLGKSRLISENQKVFQDVFQLSNENWYETSSLSYETHQAYALIQRLIQRVSGIRYDDAPRMIQKKLEPIIDYLPEDRRGQASKIFDALFSITSDEDNRFLEGESFKQELHELMDVFLRNRFSSQPTVFIFDDMHWSDAVSLQLIQQLLPLTEELPLVIICSMRVDHESSAWQIKKTAEEQYHYRYTEISLKPLSETDSNELINRLLAIPDLHIELRKNILEKSDGNPFFIEEVVRALIENKIVVSEERIENGKTNHYWVSVGDGSEFSIPDNLQALLAARMDQLEESTRATLQLASVIGRNFYLRVLQAVNTSSPQLDKQVGTLLRLDMIRESARVPEVEYSFRNPLTQEAIYKTILLKHRKEFHKRVAEAMEGLYQDRLEGKFGLLAHHYSLAGDNHKATEYLMKAANQAKNVYAYEEAEKNLRVALDLLDGINNEMYVLVSEELADVCRMVRNFLEAIIIFQEALHGWALISDGDQIIQYRLNRKILEIASEAKWSVDAQTFHQVSEISKKSQLSLQNSLDSILNQDPHPETVRMLVALSANAWRVQEPADWDSAQIYAKQAVEFADRLDDPELLSLSLGALATALDGQSMLGDHLKIARRRVQLCNAKQRISVHEEIDALRGMGAALMYVGEYDAALPYLKDAQDLAMDVRAPSEVANAVGIMAQCLFRLDRWDEVLDLETQWRDLDLKYTRERVGET